MRTTEQALNTAIAELNCLSTHRSASLDELTALSAARDCVDELLHACVAELRDDLQTIHTWPAIAYALGSSSVSTVRQQYGSKRPAADAGADEQVLSFWRTFTNRFTWDFLPTDFLHALYVQWMNAGIPDATPLPKKAFTRRLKGAATASGGWLYVRSRPGSLMSAAEPLTSQLPDWIQEASNDAVYGLRRTGSPRAAAS
jgi:hypothetical protein